MALPLRGLLIDSISSDLLHLLITLLTSQHLTQSIIHLYNMYLDVYYIYPALQCYLHEIGDLILLFTTVSAVPGTKLCT